MPVGLWACLPLGPLDGDLSTPSEMARQVSSYFLIHSSWCVELTLGVPPHSPTGYCFCKPARYEYCTVQVRIKGCKRSLALDETLRKKDFSHGLSGRKSAARPECCNHAYEFLCFLIWPTFHSHRRASPSLSYAPLLEAHTTFPPCLPVIQEQVFSTFCRPFRPNTFCPSSTYHERTYSKQCGFCSDYLWQR